MPFFPLVIPGGQFLEAHSHPDPDYPWRPWDDITYTNLTVGNGVVVARYTKLGQVIIAQYEIKFGSTSVMGTELTISTPVTAASWYTDSRMWVGGVVFLDEGLDTPSGIVRLKSTTTFELLALDSSGTYLKDVLLSATIPFTWTTDDMFGFTAIFEPAQS